MAYLGNTPVAEYYDSKTEQYNGDGNTTIFTLSREVATANDVEVIVNNVQQDPYTAFSASGTTLTFTEAPTTGSGNILVTYRNYLLTRLIPDAQSVTESMLEDGSVTTAKIADNAVTSAKIAPGTVIAADILDGTVDNNKLVTANITGAKLVANTITTRELADNAILQNNITDGAVTDTKLSTTGVVAGTYGNTTNIPVITVTAQGRVTSLSNLAFSTVPAANSINDTQIIPNIPLILSNVFVTNTATLGKVIEEANIVAQGVGTTTTVTPNDPGVIYFTGNSSDNTTINFTGLTSMNVGNVLNYTVILTNQSGSAKYVSAIQIDGQTQGSSNTFWLGGRPTFGLANTEIYTFNIIKMTATPTYNVFAQVSNFRF